MLLVLHLAWFLMNIKSTVYFGGVKPVENQNLLQHLGMQEGVLGWNRASLINRLFDIEGPVTSSWSQWIQDYKLNGQSIWEVPCFGTSHSLFWFELMRARDFFLA